MSEIEKLIEKEARELHAERCNCQADIHKASRLIKLEMEHCGEYQSAKEVLRRVADAAVQGERERATGICSRMVAWLSPSPKDGSYRRMTDKLFSDLMDAEFQLRNPDEYAQAAIRKGTPE